MVVKHIQIYAVLMSKNNFQVKIKIESRPIYYSQTKLSHRSLSATPRQRKITHSSQQRG